MKGKHPQVMTAWEFEMNALALVISKAIEDTTLTKEASVLAAAVCVVGQCRLHGIDEDVVWKEARKASPTVPAVN